VGLEKPSIKPFLTLSASEMSLSYLLLKNINRLAPFSFTVLCRMMWLSGIAIAPIPKSS